MKKLSYLDLLIVFGGYFMSEFDYLVVGAGFFGAVMAERLATEKKKKVLVIDQRDHIGGNCASALTVGSGIEFHRYGTHIFHTSSQKVMDYMDNFMKLNEYRHQVYASVKGDLFPLPINLKTINQFFDKDFTSSEAEEFIKSKALKIENPKNLEEAALSKYGTELYEAFIKSYTRKHWAIDPKDLSAKIVERLPFYFDEKSDYFHNCKWQGIPEDGYEKIFTKLLTHPNIEVRLNCNYFEVKADLIPKEKTIYTGPLDQYFNFSYGKLAWRSLYFKPHILEREVFQKSAVVNFPDQMIAHTRIHEPKHLHPERNYPKETTLVIREYPCDDPMNPYYPVRNEESMKLYSSYKQLTEKESDVIFGGRLGDYCYMDMDQTIEKALECFESL